MMGRWIDDPYQVESGQGKVTGLGLFDITTTLTLEKRVVQQNFTYKGNSETCVGYEIHMGETEVKGGQPLNRINGLPEGYFDGDKSWGTYLHGVLDNQVVVNELLRLKYENAEAKNYLLFKEEQYQKLAGWIDQHLDMQAIIANSQNE